MIKKKFLPDQHQNYWQMASIQSAAFGIPVLHTAGKLGIKYGSGAALISICIGNLVLWLVGLAIIAMTIKDRRNAIENLKDYVGKYGCWLGGFALSLAFLFWYPIQVKGSVSEIRIALEPYKDLTKAFDIRIGTTLGLIIALISMGGIKFIKWFNTLSFPFLIAFIIYAIFKNGSIPQLSGTWGISLGAILTSISLTLAGVVNLPTFFRHRRTEIDAFFALSLFVFFTTLVECFAIFLVNSKTETIFTEFIRNEYLNTFLLLLFLLVSMICVNFTNIYFASAVWEVIFPWFSQSKELAIVGMGGTLTFVFLQSQEIMSYLETLFTTFIGILGIVLIISYSVKLIVGEKQKNFEMIISFMCWLIGCSVTLFIQDIKLNFATRAFFSGIGVSILFFIIILFLEETFWTLKATIFKSYRNF